MVVLFVHLLYMSCYYLCCLLFFFFKQKTAYEMRISDWSSDVCSSDLEPQHRRMQRVVEVGHALLAAVDGEGIHGEVVGAYGKEIGRLRQRVGGQGSARHLDHDADRRQRIGNSHDAAGEAPGGFLQLLAHGAPLARGRSEEPTTELQ